MSSRSSSATSSSASPATADSAVVSRLVNSTYPWIGSLMRLTAANGWCRVIRSAPAPAGAWRPRRPAAPTGRGLPRRRPTTGSRGGSRSSRTPWRSSAANRRARAATVCVGCQVASRTRPATAAAKRSTTSTGGWSAMMSHAARRADVVAAGSGGSKVRGVRAADRIRSILNVRRALRSSSNPMRYRACVWSDGSSRYGHTVARRGAAPPS